MGVRALLQQDVAIVESGKWMTGKMTKAAFPLSKNSSLRLGSGWEWRVVHLTYGGVACRLLIAFHGMKQNAIAYLGIESGTDTRVVFMLENHSTHAGWHVHASCNHNDAPLGRLRFPTLRRIPRKGRHHTAIHGLLTKEDVLHRALNLFRAVAHKEMILNAG
jgi:hypothetical protein